MALIIGLSSLAFIITLLIILYIKFALINEIIIIILLLLIIIYIILKPFSRLSPDYTQRRTKRQLCHDKYDINKVKELGDIDYIIIGSGMSGLSSASVLSRVGYRVLVLEQHETDAGGCTHQFLTEKGYWFDSGLHYTVPHSESLLELASGKTKPVKFIKMGNKENTFDRVIIGDHLTFDIKHKEAHLPELYKKFPEETQGINEFIRLSNIMLSATKYIILARCLPRKWQFYIWKWFLGPFKNYAACTTEEIVCSLIKNHDLRAILVSLWLDTGAVPSECSFYLGACVARGLPLESGAYPASGSAEMAKCLVSVIEEHGGRVLINAFVESINIDENSTTATGVYVNGDYIKAHKGVISSVGYHNTFGQLIAANKCRQFNIPIDLGVKDSPSFVMINIGINNSGANLNLENINTWCHPINEEGDVFKCLQKYIQDPLNNEGPIMITWPSIKDKNWKRQKKTTCQILAFAKYEWFAEFAHIKDRDKNEAYQNLKKLWADKCIKILIKQYPQVKDYIDSVDVSTPLSIAKWLNTSNGSCVGLLPSPERFTNFDKVVYNTDVVTNINHLYLTGHDILLPGVVLAQLSGVVTAWRIVGFWKSCRYLFRSIFL